MDMERPTSLVAKKSLFRGNITNIQHDKNKFWWYNQMYSTYVGHVVEAVSRFQAIMLIVVEHSRWQRVEAYEVSDHAIGITDDEGLNHLVSR